MEQIKIYAASPYSLAFKFYFTASISNKISNLAFFLLQAQYLLLKFRISKESEVALEF